VTPAEHLAALRRLARDVRARNRRAMVPVESGLAKRAPQLRDPARIERAADAFEAALSAGALLGRPASAAREACVAWAAQHTARPDEPFARELFERAAKLALWAVRPAVRPLSPNQRFVLDAVVASRATRGRDPTQKEIADALGVTPARVSQLLRRLRERGDLAEPAGGP